jgi:hypothetical protein
MMFWKNKGKEQKGSKLSGPKDMPQFVKIYLESNKVVDKGTIPFLKSVTKNSEKGSGIFDIRLFDPADAEARHINVLNYDTLTEKPELTIAEGWFEEATKKVEIVLKKTNLPIKFFTYDEIKRQIEELKQPGSSVFFYTNAGTGIGGPLGKGAALIKLNVPVEGKKTKKYVVYGVNVIDMQPVQDGSKIFDSDKAQDIAKWLSEMHKPRVW